MSRVLHVPSLALVLSWCSTPTSAQGGEATDLAALRAQVEALTKRVETLESERSSVRAPFSVVDEGGRPLLKVEREPQSGGTTVRIEGPDGLHVRIGATSGAGGVAIQKGGETLAGLVGGPKGSRLAVTDGRGNVAEVGSSQYRDDFGALLTRGDKTQIAMTLDPEGGSLQTFDAGGRPIATFSSVRESPLEVFGAQGKSIFRVGTLKETQRPALVLSDDVGKSRVEFGIASANDGAYVWLFDQAAPEARVNILARKGNVQLGLRNEEGQDVFFAGATENTERRPRLRLGNPSGSRVEFGEAKDGEGSYFSLYDGAGKERVALTDSLFELFDADATAVLTAGRGSANAPPKLILGDPAKARAELGLLTDDAGSYASLFDGANAERLVLHAGDRTMIELSNGQGTPLFQAGVRAADATPQLVLGHPDEAHAELGVLVGGAGSFLSLFDATDTERIVATGASDRPRLEISHDVDVIVGASSGEPPRTGVFVRRGDAELVTLRGDAQSGGRVVIGSPEGRPVGALFHAQEGGQMSVTASQGGQTLVTLAGTSAGGVLGLYNPAGERLWYSEAARSGLLQVLGANGFITVDGGQAGPHLKLMDGEGTIMVQAGITASSQVGTVMVGPGGEGVAASLTGGRPASQILGVRK